MEQAVESHSLSIRGGDVAEKAARRAEAVGLHVACQSGVHDVGEVFGHGRIQLVTVY